MTRRIALALLLAAAAAAHADEIRVLSGNGARSAVAELAARFERASGHKVSLQFAVNVEVKRRIDAGEAFDAAILNPPVLDALIREGKVVADTRTVIGRAGIGAAVRADAALPDLSTVDAFKRTLLASQAVAYPGQGASGKYFAGLVERLGIGPQMKPKMRPLPAESNVEALTRGEADLVVVVASRISGVPGVKFAGLIPQELQTWIGFTGGVGSAAKAPQAARHMLRSFTTPAAAEVLAAAGVQPFVE